MADWHEVKMSIPDPALTGNAELYELLSDGIWESTISADDSATVGPLDPIEVRDAINEVVREIDEGFVVSGIGKTIKLEGDWPGQEAEISAQRLDEPIAATIGTHNWDQRFGKVRHVNVDGQGLTAVFTDGHIDYHREIFAQLFLGTEQGWSSSLTYSIQRNQGTRRDNAQLYLKAWHNGLATSGYSGNVLQWAILRPKEEIRFLKTLQELGGVAIDPEKLALLTR